MNYQLQYQKQDRYMGQNLTQQELNYYAYEDMMNVLSIATQLDEFEKYLAYHPELRNQAEQLLLIQRNRLLCQINLSNTIHADLKFTAQSDGLQNQLQQAKSNCHNIASNYLNTFQSSFVQEQLRYYLKNNLSQGNYLNTLPLKKTNNQAQFDDQVVQKVCSAMNREDVAIAQVRTYGYQVPLKNQIEYRLNQKRQETKQNLSNIDFNTLNVEATCSLSDCKVF